MYKIVKYQYSYREELIEFITKILVEEYGFERFREKLKNTEFCDNEQKSTWIAVNDNNNIVGTITLEKKDEKEAFLRKFYISEEYRGKGLSKELFNVFLEFARDNSYKKITLGTYENLNRAIGFYIKNGFKEYNKITEYNNERHFCLEIDN